MPTRLAPTTRRPTRRPRSEPAFVPSGTLPRDTIAQRLAYCRNERRITQAAAAKAIGIKAQSLSGLESGISKAPSSDTLMKMRDRLGYNPDFIMHNKLPALIARFEELAEENALLGMFRELREEHRRSLVQIAQTLVRSQGGTPSADDPWREEPPG